MEKRKGIIIKILFSVLVVFILMIIKSNTSNAFTMGSLDINGGEGITSGPQPYLFGNYYCIDSSLPLTRTEDGTKNTSPIVHYNRQNNSYYNEEITYGNESNVKAEESIAAGYLAFTLGAGTNAQLQNVVWSSGMWSGKDGYVNNLSKYNGTKVSGSGSALYERAQGWANFYYNILKPSGMKLNIDTKPTSEEDLRIYVDQNNRTYTEGPYMINLLDSSGNVITNNSTENYNGCTLGNLVYNEIIGANLGSSYFQFAKLTSATATVTFTDGTAETYSNITILDEGGNVLGFPRFGEIFYIRVEIPSGESRTVSKIEPHFNVQYYTEIPGTATKYSATGLAYEINIDKAAELTNSHYYSSGSDERLTSFYTNESIYDMMNHYSATAGQVKNEESLKQYFIDLILDDEDIDGVRIMPDFTAAFSDTTIWGDYRDFNDVDKYYSTWAQAL